MSAKALFFLSFLKGIFTGYRFQVDRGFFFFQYIKDVVSPSSHLHWFQWQICCHSNLCSFVHKVIFFSSGCFYFFFLNQYDWAVWMWRSFVQFSLGSLSFFVLWVCTFHQVWNIFGYYVFRFFFSISPFLSSLSGTPVRCLLDCLTVPLWLFF